MEPRLYSGGSMAAFCRSCASCSGAWRACRFIGAGAVRRERRADGADQRVPATHGDATHSHRGTGTELRGVETIRRRSAISTHEINDQTCHSELANIAPAAAAFPAIVHHHYHHHHHHHLCTSQTMYSVTAAFLRRCQYCQFICDNNNHHHHFPISFTTL